jgi:hypothetical protein
MCAQNTKQSMLRGSIARLENCEKCITSKVSTKGQMPMRTNCYLSLLELGLKTKRSEYQVG